MKHFLIFIIGFVAGVSFLLLVQLIIDFITNYSDKKVKHIEVKSKKGNATLYTGMTKESVIFLIGEPDKINSKTLKSITYEVWGYLLTNKYFNDIELEFVNGKLRRVRKKNWK
ncbi:MAG: hypothetical protein VB024_05635 [Dysgonamonadaceae bacterium]|jgi:hypothetical protein|nr:hypothetical protein [Dysgonamonadaceae bacterium]MDD3309753.1 hypothetical protein [Dysgonamonadaceae bacterium]MDD3901354.1 hypothetical protein [Dysgonamonadaceae bacterium]MDD4399583.1 hypothetical protein [Dysgonamonadaceae bacterium]MEA5081089.1 hypothetical protein [Dysgonamonadaceae bacterium]